MQLSRLAVGVVVLALAGCSNSPAETSDPAAWTPPRVDAGAVAPAGGDGGIVLDSECLGTPPVDPSLKTSTATSLSHLSGQPCLAACHEAGGTAKTVFAAAGTVFRSQTSREVARSGGIVQGVAATSLEVDRCGNIYAIAGALRTKVNTSQPFVQNPTFRRMDKPLLRQPDAGSCNQSGCHDFGGKLRWGIYF